MQNMDRKLLFCTQFGKQKLSYIEFLCVLEIVKMHY